MTVTFQESGLNFGPFEENSLFRIELSNGYRSIQEHTKIAEFIWVAPSSNLWVVEAKSTLPRPTSEKYEAFFEDIKSKLTNTLVLTVTSLLHRQPEIYNELPQQFIDLDWATTKFKLTLVIPEAPNSHLPPITEKLRRILSGMRKPWGIDELSINVLNKEQAIKFGLAS